MVFFTRSPDHIYSKKQSEDKVDEWQLRAVMVGLTIGLESYQPPSTGVGHKNYQNMVVDKSPFGNNQNMGWEILAYWQFSNNTLLQT